MTKAVIPDARASDERSGIVEIGWILLPDVPEARRDLVERAGERLVERLGQLLPDFEWRLRVQSLRAGVDGSRAEPIAWLLRGSTERTSHAWDFALVTSGRELRGSRKGSALAMSSRALASAIVSLEAILPPDEEPPSERAVQRLAALGIHLIGDLVGGGHEADPALFTHPPEDAADLDRMERFSDAGHRTLRALLGEVADPRLEEEPRRPRSALLFTLRAGLEHAGEIAGAIVRARPWELPLRLGRLTAASVSALLFLALTAEVWDLALTQSAAAMAVLSVLALLTGTAFVTVRQGLLVHRGRLGPTEQTVMSNLSAVGIVGFGMLTTYLFLFATLMALSSALFAPELVARWAPAAEQTTSFAGRTTMGALVASLGMLIGSLGASFEGNHHFQHVVFVDEEI